MAGLCFVKKPLAITVACLTVAGLLLLYLFNPSEVKIFPVCLFKYMTGLPCPGCGMQRAIHQLMHGHLKSSFLLCPYAYFLGGVFLGFWVFPRVTQTFGFVLFVVGTTFIYAILRMCGCVP